MLGTSHYRQILVKLGFSKHICKKYSTINLMKIRPVGAELFHAGRRTDITKLTVTFSNSANALKKGIRLPNRERMFVLNVVNVYRTSRRHIPEEGNCVSPTTEPN
jgi:hypothetical protein